MCYYVKPDDIYKEKERRKKKDNFIFSSNEYIHLLPIHGTSLQCLGVLFSLARYDTFSFFILSK